MREYLLVFLAAAVVSYLLCVFARELALRAGAVARVRDRDVHDIPIPYFGGVAMLGGLGAGLLVARHLPFLGGASSQTLHDAGVVTVAGAIICAVGVLDDLLELDAITKFGGQILAAGFMVLNGVQLYSLNLPVVGQLVLDSTQAVLLSVVLVVGTVNAVNFIDGLDGLAGGTVAIGAIAFLVFSYKLADVNGLTLAVTSGMLCAALAGAAAGFLPHNFFPARIFMGDSGSMLLGLVLSGAALSMTGQFAGISIDGLSALVPVLLPIAILVIPLLDLVMAVIRRTRRGQAFYQPDKEHLHHRLLEIGHSQRRAVLIIWLWASLIGFGAVLLNVYGGTFTVIGVALWACFTMAMTWLLPRVDTPI